MSSISEVLESANITHDSKARRVLNTAPDQKADITLSELEAGVTIERLETLNVPVYQYGGQITIHGIFPDTANDIRVNGYKSLLFNGNKSLGIKYVAIDSAKKELLAEANRFRKDRKWSIHLDSQGMELWSVFHSADHEADKKAVIECYNNTPDDLYIGGKQAAALMFGGYAVIIYIGAIYQVNLWALIKAITGIENEAELNALKQAEREKWEIESTKRKAECEAAEAKRQSELSKAIADFKPGTNWKPFNGPITEPGIYAEIQPLYSRSGSTLVVFKVKKHGKGYKISYREFDNFVFTDWECHKFRIWDHPKQITNGWQIQ